MEEEKKTKEVTLQLWGEGIRIDVIDESQEVLECYNALREGELFDIQVLEEGKEPQSISREELGNDLGWDCPDDDDFDKVSSWDNECQLEDPEENEDYTIERINWVQTKVYGNVKIELNSDEVFDPGKVRLLYTEFVLPDSEEPVYFGVLYDGKEYPIELDIDSEREISVNEIWSAQASTPKYKR